MNKYTAEGMESFHKHRGKYANPYKIGSNEYNNFERGWIQAQRRCDPAVLRQYEKEPRVGGS